MRVCIGSVLVLIAAVGAGAAEQGEMRSLDPASVFGTLDLTLPGLEPVKAAVDAGSHEAALEALRAYYREKYLLAGQDPAAAGKSFPDADRTVQHIFQWGPYEPADYGEEINWEWDPAGDIEWVAAVYRFYWAPGLAEAYAATRDEKYAQAFVDLTRDWIEKHPLEERERVHYVYKNWRGFPWLDIQTGIRAQKLCECFPVMVHAEAFTPEFLGVFMASVYDHQIKTEREPMNAVHNKAVFEQRGFAEIASTFPEFSDADRWMKMALERTTENLLAQTTTDGVQREWSGGYHLGVLRDAVEIMKLAERIGVTAPEAYRDRVVRMYDYLFATATPDLGFMMFGDTARPIDLPDDRARWPLYSTLMSATELLGDPKYAARARLDRDNLPEQTSYAFKEAGMYVFRSDWGQQAIYLDLHCSPKAISGHDQQDNGTFELYAYGRWLMNDTGYYTYGHDPDARNWHRQTQVHQTLTIDGQNSEVAGRHLLWRTAPGLELLAVENESYPGLVHRRTVWFVDDRYFVFLDEAIGASDKPVDLNFQFAPGAIVVDGAGNSVRTTFDDSNVLIQAAPDAEVVIEEQPGWFAWHYGERIERPAVRFRYTNAPLTMVTVVAPYRGTEPPAITATAIAEPGAARVEVTVKDGDTQRTLGRDLENGVVW